ncbi:MAG: NgoMIV family type II restriction endonuclease [Dehalococcoidia bacterium]
MRGLISEARAAFHKALLSSILSVNAAGIPTNADSSHASSAQVARLILRNIGNPQTAERLKGQISGSKFEQACADFLDETFLKLDHLRPGNWDIIRSGDGSVRKISRFAQYQHISALAEATRENRELSAILGRDYLITPDVVICRWPEPDDVLNHPGEIVDESHPSRSILRSSANPAPILHASVSCKWTIRSDRAQNSRSEALNLVKNRKGPLPHIVAITAEPSPSRIASLALGTGELDCVYHFALPELNGAVAEFASTNPAYEDSVELLRTMTDGGRLKDIGDLSLDLAT